MLENNKQKTKGYWAFHSLIVEMARYSHPIGIGKFERVQNGGYKIKIEVQKRTPILLRIPSIDRGLISVYTQPPMKNESSTAVKQTPKPLTETGCQLDCKPCVMCSNGSYACFEIEECNAGSAYKPFVSASKRAIKHNSSFVGFTAGPGSYWFKATGTAYM